MVLFSSGGASPLNPNITPIEAPANMPIPNPLLFRTTVSLTLMSITSFVGMVTKLPEDTSRQEVCVGVIFNWRAAAVRPPK